MATLCTHCGKALPRDDARFCNHCGKTFVPTHSSTPQATSASKSPSEVSTTRSEQRKPVLKEQRANLPSDNALRRTAQKELFEREKPLNKEAASDISPSVAKESDSAAKQKGASDTGQPQAAVAWPEPITHVAMGDVASDEKKSSSEPEQIDFPVLPTVPHTDPPVRDLNVKVWKSEEALPVDEHPTVQEAIVEDLPTVPLPVVSSPQQHVSEEDPDIEEHPTMLLEAASPETSSPQSDTNVPEQKEQTGLSSDVEHLDTVPLVAQEKPVQASQPKREESQPQVMPALSAPPAQYQPQAMPVSQAQPVKPSGAIMPALLRIPRPGRSTTLVAAGLLVLLVLGSLAVWIYQTRPFDVAATTVPVQNFKDGTLGISLSYPTGWTTRVDRGNSTLFLHDSSNTAQVNIIVANANNEDLTTYLQQQATKLGMTGAKQGSPLSFAGETWQQIQGSTQQSGANYSGTILATIHGSRLYTLIQQAPPVTYSEEENLVFAPIRSSLQFL